MVQSNSTTKNLYFHSTCHPCFPLLLLIACAAWSICAVSLWRKLEKQAPWKLAFVLTCFCFLWITPLVKNGHMVTQTPLPTQLKVEKGGWAESWEHLWEPVLPRSRAGALGSDRPREAPGQSLQNWTLRTPAASLRAQAQVLCWPCASLLRLLKDQALSTMPKRSWALSHSYPCWLQHPKLQSV